MTSKLWEVAAAVRARPSVAMTTRQGVVMSTAYPVADRKKMSRDCEPKSKKANLATDGHGFTRIRNAFYLYPCDTALYEIRTILDEERGCGYRYQRPEHSGFIARLVGREPCG